METSASDRTDELHGGIDLSRQYWLISRHAGRQLRFLLRSPDAQPYAQLRSEVMGALSSTGTFYGGTVRHQGIRHFFVKVHFHGMPQPLIFQCKRDSVPRRHKLVRDGTMEDVVGIMGVLTLAEAKEILTTHQERQIQHIDADHEKSLPDRNLLRRIDKIAQVQDWERGEITEHEAGSVVCYHRRAETVRIVFGKDWPPPEEIRLSRHATYVCLPTLQRKKIGGLVGPLFSGDSRGSANW